jgi:hypothetical protein
VHHDWKIYRFGDKEIGIGQTELTDIEKLMPPVEELRSELRKAAENSGLFMAVLMLTDILEERSLVLIHDDNGLDLTANAFNRPVNASGMIELPGVMSRKKAVGPPPCGGFGLIAQSLQTPAIQIHHGLFVIHKGDSFTTSVQFSFGLLFFHSRLFQRGEIDLKDRSFPKRALNQNTATMSLHDAMNHRKTHSRALACFLGGVVGFKDSIHDLGLDALTRIPHCKSDVVTGREDPIKACFFFLKNYIFKGHFQYSPLFGHGIGRIGYKIHYNLINLGCIPHNAAWIVRNALFEIDAGGDDGSEHLHGFF